MKKMLFIYNPNAGTGALKPKLSNVIEVFIQAGYEVTIYPTQTEKDALEQVKSYTDPYDLIICSGGDGTLNEVVNGMMRRESKIPIGYIPAGSTNDFASSLKISKDVSEAAHTAVNGSEFPCDVGKFNDEYFVYIAAFGLFTSVSYETDQGTKNVLGHLAYILEGVKQLFNIPSYHVKVIYGDNMIEDDFVYGMVTNSKSVGGFTGLIGNQVVFDDGVFEVTLIKMPKNPVELSEIIAALTNAKMDSKYMYCFQASQVYFESEEEIPWTLDGEFGGDHNSVMISNLKQQFHIMVPKSEENVLTGDKEQG